MRIILYRSVKNRHSVIDSMQNERTTEWNGQTIIQKIVRLRKLNPLQEQVYRLVRNNPPQAEDFKSTWEEFPGRFPEPTIKNSGVSIYTDPQDIERLKKRIRQLRDRKTAEGELNPALGFILQKREKRNLIIRGGYLLEQNLGLLLRS